MNDWSGRASSPLEDIREASRMVRHVPPRHAMSAAMLSSGVLAAIMLGEEVIAGWPFITATDLDVANLARVGIR